MKLISNLSKEKIHMEVNTLIDKLGNMMGMIKQIQQRIEDTQKQLQAEHIEVTSGETLRIIVTGHQTIEKIEINPAYLTPQSGPILQDLLVATINKGLMQAKTKYDEEMGKVATELNLPKIPGLF